MKILFYSDTVFGFGGVQRVLAVIAKSLSESHEVTILTTDRQKKVALYGYAGSSVHFDFLAYSESPLFQRLWCKGYSFLYKYLLPHTRLTSKGYAKSFFLPSHKRILVQKINAGHYDVVIGVHAFMALHLSAVKSQIQARTIGWMHNSYEAFFEKKTPYLPGLKDFFKYQMAELDEVVVLSGADKERYEKRLNLTPVVIYNPLTIEIRGRANLQDRCFLSVGRFSRQHKGFDLLIKAFALFAARHTDWTLHIVGEGPEEKLYRSLIMENRLEDRVRIHPFTKDVCQHYLGGSVYVMASRWEGMPLVLMEAMAYGLPVIASDIPIAKELLEGKGMAVFFERENVSQLADCLHYMAVEADLEAMGEKSMACAENFKTDAIIKQWEKILN